ncbi:hypothetical protein [Natronohydrobacter thiooxidans]|uniref:hypothetical protein n=1 Tax=Natronohydrobacter thiooxidans TaxID=87172 RepID=UPI0008FF68B9|nr:hypothetical protein [Natronohydrobacter thiooxidans]
MMQGQSQHWLRATAPRATLSEDLRVLRQLEGVIDRLDSFEVEAPQKRLSLGQMARGLEKRLARLRALPRD